MKTKGKHEGGMINIIGSSAFVALTLIMMLASCGMQDKKEAGAEPVYTDEVVETNIADLPEGNDERLNGAGSDPSENKEDDIVTMKNVSALDTDDMSEHAFPERSGWVYQPDESMEQMLSEAEKAWTGQADTNISMAFFGEADEVFQMTETSSYKVFYHAKDNRMIVRPEDDVLLWVDVPVLSTHEELPTITEYDLDGDEGRELLIQPHILNGTGYREDMILIVDKDENSTWGVHQLKYDQYMNVFMDRISCRLKDDDAALFMDGSPVGSSVDVSDLPEVKNGEGAQLLLESLVTVIPYKHAIQICTVPMLSPLSFRTFDVVFWYTIPYEGNGIFGQGDLTCKPYGTEVYRDITDALDTKNVYHIWSNSGFDVPLLLIAEADVNESSQSWGLQTPSSACEVFLLRDGTQVSFGKLDSGIKERPIGIGPRGLYLAKGDKVEIYEPDFEKGCMTVTETMGEEGIEESVPVVFEGA